MVRFLFYEKLSHKTSAYNISREAVNIISQMLSKTLLPV